ncbi:TetR/AcrR family transcriptional regulator [Thalassolituus sp. LLYu03]|uniref:TetR/AcrR family transcriptional regulator n=1 Tax=Thalassolituus sp. LLYu03 TaxID=3421656 RepID=UPI003D2740FB
MTDGHSDIVLRLRQALLARMAQDEWQRITVSNLAADAGISRQTFYQYFSGRDELLLDYVDDMFDAFYSDIAERIASTVNPDSDISIALFAQWRAQADFARLVFRARVDDLLIRRFRSYIARVMGLYVRSHGLPVKDAERLGFMVDYLAGASWLVLERWVTGDFRYPEAQLAALFSQLTQPGFLDALHRPVS